jgi:hypothetical protein
MTRLLHVAVVSIVVGVFASSSAVLAQTAATGTGTVAKNASIYVQPNPPTTLPPLRVAAVGTTLKVIGGEEGWLQVQFEDPQFGRRVGWVRSEFITVRRPELEPMDLSVKPQQPAPNRTAIGTTESVQRQAGPADQPAFLYPGVVEVEALGSFTAMTVADETVTTGEFRGAVGVMATRIVQVGAATDVLKLGESTAGTFGGFASFHVPVRGAVVPFVGVGVGFSWATGSSEHPVALQVFGGVKAFLRSGEAAIVIQPFYEHDFLPGDGAPGVNSFGVAFGISVFVGGTR